MLPGEGPGVAGAEEWEPSGDRDGEKGSGLLEKKGERVREDGQGVDMCVCVCVCVCVMGEQA